MNQRAQKPQPRNTPLVGSYAPEDCLFLLKPIRANYQSIADKETLIQSGKMHYSQIIHQESAPSAAYTTLFHHMTQRYKKRLAQEIMLLASHIHTARQGDITLLSLARAGTPIGVLLHRALTHHFSRRSTHYSISVVRDRGIDTQALHYVLEHGHTDRSIVFVDGWTAKGVITHELHRAIDAFNAKHHTRIPRELFVISDIGGTADAQATFDDYTIPSALLNSTVSGLVSRSILNDEIGPTDFHGCVPYTHLKPNDKSVWFIDEIFSQMQRGVQAPPPTLNPSICRQRANSFLQWVRKHHNVSDMNRIKPGIAEATRVLLRRVPDQLLLRQYGAPETLHLERLAAEKLVPTTEVTAMPFGACSLIKDVTH
ncbi:MAG: cysteine protease StiP family protein [Gammaproteobacteria bacterium]